MKILDYDGLKQLTNKIKEKLNEKLTINNLFEQAIESKTKGSTTLSAELKNIEDKIALKATQSEAETGTNNTKYMTPQATKQAILKLAPEPDLSNYVQKDGTKVLSTNDYTSADQRKLSEIETGAQKNKVTSVQGRTGAVNITKNDVKSMGFPEHVVLTESEFKALSSTQQNAPDIFYYIKE